MSRRTLYLDIDGCLNTINRQKRAYGRGGYQDYNIKVLNQEKKPMALDNHTMDHITNLDWGLCYALETLIRVYQIEDIVICSSWKRVYDEDQLKLLFISKGFPFIADLIIGTTPNSKNNTLLTDRDNEIKLDMEHREIDDYYILDDEVWDYESSGFDPKRLVLPVLRSIAERFDNDLGDFVKQIRDIPRHKLDKLNEKMSKYKLETIQTYKEVEG